MTGILDSSVHIGKESTYGTPVALTRSFEAQVDDWERDHAQLESVGFRAGNQGVRSDRRLQINLGGSGSLQVDVLNKGMGLLWESILPALTGPTQDAATTAYDQTHSTDDDGPTDSYTIQVWRPYADNSGIEEFTHHGCMPTGFKFSQPTEDLAKFQIDYDFEDVDYATAAATPTYPAAQTPFSWADASVSIDGSTFDEVLSWELNGDLAMRTDRRYLRASVLKKAPKRSGIPEISGLIDADWVKTEFYDDFVAGNIVPIVFQWLITGDSIESGKDHTITLTMAACQFDGQSPATSLTDAPKQPLPFKALYDGTNPVLVLAQKTTDTSL